MLDLDRFEESYSHSSIAVPGLDALIAELRASRKVVEAFRRDLASMGDDFVESSEALQEYDSLVNASPKDDPVMPYDEFIKAPWHLKDKP